MRPKLNASCTPLPRNSAASPRRKRWQDKHILHSSDEEDADDANGDELLEDEWPINCILDESETQYLIDWEGDYSPTWEPKENANDAAIQAWEDKKRERAKNADPQDSLGVTQSGIASLADSEEEQSVDRLEQEARQDPLGSQDSELFVPPDTVSDLIESQENYEFSQRSVGSSQPIAPNHSHLNTGFRPSFALECKPSIERHRHACVFDSYPISSIPPEFRLPGEFEQPFHSVTHTDTSTTAPVPDSRNLNLGGVASEAIGLSQLPRPTAVIQPSAPADEIPETPQVVLNSFHSSTPRIRSERGIFGSQGYITSITLPGTMDDQSQKKEGLSLAETMEKYSHIEGSTPREKIRNAYARLREKVVVETPQNDPSATPSSVGDIEPAAPASIPETVAPLSVRVEKETPHHADSAMEPAPEIPLQPMEHQQHDIQTIHPSALTVSHAETVPPGSVHLGPSEFAVPLPMDSRVKDDYDRVLLNESQSIWGLISGTDAEDVPDSEVEQEQVMLTMQQVLERLSNVATHPDLNIAEHLKDVESDLSKEAAWAEYSSAKFLLLSYLTKAASDHDIHLVLAVRGEKTQKVVERYLIGKGLTYTRPREEMGSGTNLEVSMVKGPFSFGIQMTAHNDGIMEPYRPPAAIIALDSSLNTKSPSIEHMRTTYARHGNLLPVVRLMVANSSEHIELCFPGLPTLDRLALVLRHTVRLRDSVGDLQDDALGVSEDAGEILTCLLSDNFNAFWSLPTVEPLHGVSSSEATQRDENLQPVASGTEIAKPAGPAVPKRQLAEDAPESASKRPRMDESQDTTQSTDISKGVTQTLDNDLQTLEKNLLQMRNSHAAALEKLQKALISAQSRLQEREKILETLQHRYETRTSELHKVRQERDRLFEQKTASEQRLEKQKEDITKLKDERTQLKHELEDAREALKTGGGTVADLESAREEIRRLTKENAGLERKSDYERKQAEYTREQYQTASNVAAQAANELRQLREENETLKRKLAGEAARLREINIKNDETRHLSRVAELEAILSSREELLRRKEDELHEIRRNRPSTRSTSTQPRSPKWNAANSRPTSPGINNGNFLGRGSSLRFSSEMSL